jgi:uncharacterized membrane protein (DUF4010 family)
MLAEARSYAELGALAATVLGTLHFVILFDRLFIVYSVLLCVVALLFSQMIARYLKGTQCVRERASERVSETSVQGRGE